MGKGTGGTALFEKAPGKKGKTVKLGFANLIQAGASSSITLNFKK